MNCEHLKVKAEPVLDYESDRIFVAWVCEDCKQVLRIGETWEEYMSKL